MNNLPPFTLEQYLLQHEHKAELSLCSSGLDSLTLRELLAFGDSETLTLWEKQTLGYSDPQGAPRLRDEIGRLYASLPARSLGLFSGAAEAIFCGLSALLTPQDHAIIITPCYQSLKSVPASICGITEIPLQMREQTWELDIRSIEQAIQPHTRVLVMNFPNNPTGALPSDTLRQALIALARAHDLYIFSDEVYRGLELADTPQWPPMVDAYEKGISVGSLSKLFAMPGVRCGWLACRDQSILEKAVGFKHYTTICNNGPGEILALMALRAHAEIIPRNRSVLAPRFVLMHQFLERHPAVFDWVAPQGGCLVFPRLILQGDSSGIAERFALDLLAAEKVLVLAGQLYDFPGEFLRLSYASKTLPQALERLERFIRQHHKSVFQNASQPPPSVL